MISFFPRKRCEGFTFIVRGLGVGPVFASRVSSRRVSSSHVVSGRRVVRIPCLWKSCKRRHFDGFTSVVASFRVAGVAFCDVWTCCVTRRKSFCVAGAIIWQRFQKMSCIFHGRCCTSDVSCCVFSANRMGRAARSGNKVQIAWQAWPFVRCDEKGRQASPGLWGKLQNRPLRRCR